MRSYFNLTLKPSLYPHLFTSKNIFRYPVSIVKQIYELAYHILPGQKCTFLHINLYSWLCTEANQFKCIAQGCNSNAICPLGLFTFQPLRYQHWSLTTIYCIESVSAFTTVAQDSRKNLSYKARNIRMFHDENKQLKSIMLNL